MRLSCNKGGFGAALYMSVQVHQLGKSGLLLCDTDTHTHTHIYTTHFRVRESVLETERHKADSDWGVDIDAVWIAFITQCVCVRQRETDREKGEREEREKKEERRLPARILNLGHSQILNILVTLMQKRVTS